MYSTSTVLVVWVFCCISEQGQYRPVPARLVFSFLFSFPFVLRRVAEVRQAGIQKTTCELALCLLEVGGLVEKERVGERLQLLQTKGCAGGYTMASLMLTVYIRSYTFREVGCYYSTVQNLKKFSWQRSVTETQSDLRFKPLGTGECFVIFMLAKLVKFQEFASCFCHSLFPFISLTLPPPV